MHDVYAKMVIIFFEGFIEVNCKHCRGTLFENCEDIGIGLLFKGKNETKDKVFNKSQSLVNIFLKLYFLVFFLTKSVHL